LLHIRPTIATYVSEEKETKHSALTC